MEIQNVKIYTKESLKKAMASSHLTKYFFHPDTVKFWGSRLEYVRGDGYFITSEEDRVEFRGRCYTIQFYDGERTNRISGLWEYDSLKDARSALDSILEEQNTVINHI